MSGFVYKWTNSVNGKWYIGSHKGSIDDGYRHTSEVMKLAETKYGLENFTREILFDGDYEKDQVKNIESKYLQKEDAANNPNSYNRTNIAGPNMFSEETRQKLSDAHKGKTFEEIYGIEGAAKRRISQSKKMKGKATSAKLGQSYEERFGSKKAQEIKAKQSAHQKGKSWDERYGIEAAAKRRQGLRERNANGTSGWKSI